MPAFALTVFTGAFLLFQIQPLLGKYILPWYGGGPGVWTTCMMFFQVMLVGGYLYAHLLAQWVSLRRQLVVHLALLGLALVFLPITPGDRWRPSGDTQPVLGILALLGATLGVPYLLLSSTGPLLQHWFSRAYPGRSPYRLYALSNAGSLLALITYPFAFEPHLTRKAQAGFWGWGLAAYAVCTVACAFKLWRTKATAAAILVEPESSGSETAGPASFSRKLMWVLLPAAASVLLLAVTNKLCQDVAAVPFLWVAPLTIYLLSFILCFERPRWYARLPFTMLLIGAMVGMCWALIHGDDLSTPRQVALYCTGLFICCVVCHGEVYRLRPRPEQLTSFYLLLSVGGALGGVFVGVVAPLLFQDYFELHLGLLACATLFLATCAGASGRAEAPGTWRWLGCALPILAFGGLDWVLRYAGGQSTAAAQSFVTWTRVGVWMVLALLIGSWILRGSFKKFHHWRLLVCLWLLLGLAALGTVLALNWHGGKREVVYRSRNFYGVLTVYERRKEEPEAHHFLLQHGHITHGLQLAAPDQRRWLTTYYGEESGIGAALKALPSGFRRVGVVGLGTGSLAAHGDPGDYMRFYEINPRVEQLARARFTYLQDSLARTEVVLGDARLSLERESPQGFDLLALDAFSSDSIPVHLLTTEAFEAYQRHLKATGVLAIHISNHYLDLEPVVAALAKKFDFKMATIDVDEADEDERWWLYASTWVLLTRNEALLATPGLAALVTSTKTQPAKTLLWTDDFSGLYSILK